MRLTIPTTKSIRNDKKNLLFWSTIPAILLISISTVFTDRIYTALESFESSFHIHSREDILVYGHNTCVLSKLIHSCKELILYHSVFLAFFSDPHHSISSECIKTIRLRNRRRRVGFRTSVQDFSAIIYDEWLLIFPLHLLIYFLGINLFRKKGEKVKWRGEIWWGKRFEGVLKRENELKWWRGFWIYRRV